MTNLRGFDVLTHSILKTTLWATTASFLQTRKLRHREKSLPEATYRASVV